MRRFVLTARVCSLWAESADTTGAVRKYIIWERRWITPAVWRWAAAHGRATRAQSWKARFQIWVITGYWYAVSIWRTTIWHGVLWVRIVMRNTRRNGPRSAQRSKRLTQIYSAWWNCSKATKRLPSLPATWTRTCRTAITSISTTRPPVPVRKWISCTMPIKWSLLAPLQRQA